MATIVDPVANPSPRVVRNEWLGGREREIVFVRKGAAAHKMDSIYKNTCVGV